MESAYIQNTGKYIEYLKLTVMSLNQDLENLSNQMDSLDPASKDFAELDIEYNWTSGQVAGVEHALSVAIDMMRPDMEESNVQHTITR
jgi:hypothetical protein